MTDLSSPVKRELTQTREISCTGYAREDGLWDIEAIMVDIKPIDVSHPKYGAPKPAGQPLHEMKIRITIDGEMLIHAAEAVTIRAPFGPCSIPPTIFPKLKGLSFGKGWKKGVAEIMGGTSGCTHLRELLNNMATVAYQTVASSSDFMTKLDKGGFRPFYIGTCHAYRESGPVVENLYPDLYQPPVKS